MQKENERQGKGDVGHPSEGAQHDGAAEHLPFVLNVIAAHVLNLTDAEGKAPGEPEAHKKRNHQVAADRNVADEGFNDRIARKREETHPHPAHAAGGEFVFPEFAPIEPLQKTAEHRRKEKRQNEADRGVVKAGKRGRRGVGRRNGIRHEKN